MKRSSVIGGQPLTQTAPGQASPVLSTAFLGGLVFLHMENYKNLGVVRRQSSELLVSHGVHAVRGRGVCGISVWDP